MKNDLHENGVNTNLLYYFSVQVKTSVFCFLILFNSFPLKVSFGNKVNVKTRLLNESMVSFNPCQYLLVQSQKCRYQNSV